MSTRKLMIGSAISVSIIVAISKVLGFLRDAIIAFYFGATSQTDAFFLANNMPALLFPAICSSISLVFLPQYIKKKVNETDEKIADQYASNVLNISCIIAVILGIIGVILSPLVVWIFAPGFDYETKKLAIVFTRIIMSTFVFLMLQYMLSAILNANKAFGRPQMVGIVLNIVCIFSIIFGFSHLGIYSLILGTVLGSFAQVVFLCIFLKGRFKYSFIFKINKEIKELFILTLPVILGNALVQIHEIVDKIVGSLLGNGAVSALSYGATLNSLVRTIIITAISTVYYPFLSELSAKKETEKFNMMINRTFSGIILLLMPITIITMICAKEIVEIVYGRGNFEYDAVLLTSSVLFFYAVGFIFNGIREVAAKTLYAFNEVRVVTLNGAVSVLCNIVFSLLLSRFLGVGGISLATALADIIAAVLLIRALKKQFIEISFYGVRTSIKKGVVSVIVITPICFVIRMYMVSKNVNTILCFVIVTIIGLALYLLILKMENTKEIGYFKDIINIVKRRK